MGNNKNLELKSGLSRGGGLLFSNKKNKGSYEIGNDVLYGLVIDCNPCVQSAIETETDYTCPGGFGLYLRGERVGEEFIPELYDYVKELLSIGGERDVPSVWNHAYKFNAEKHKMGEVITYPRLGEDGRICKIGIIDSKVITCKNDKLIPKNILHSGQELVDFFNEQGLRQRSLYKQAMTTDYDCGTSTIKTIFDRYLIDATMSNMYLNYLENNGIPGIIYFLKSAKEAGMTEDKMKKVTHAFLQGLKGPENTGKSLATGLLDDVKFPPVAGEKIVTEAERRDIETGMLKAFGIAPEMLGQSSETGGYSKYKEMKKIYESTRGAKARDFKDANTNNFFQNFDYLLRYPELANYEFKSEIKPEIDLEEAREEVKLGLLTVDEYRELVGRDAIEVPEVIEE